MSLDIGLANAKTTQPYPSMRIAFDDDGYYWFCFPFFEELQKRTGEMIDLYNGAWFTGGNLAELKTTLARIAEAARAMPPEWDIVIGHSIGSYLAPTPPTPMSERIEREALLSLIRRFDALVDEAIREQKWIACLGD